jgi:hypothetical protein
MVHEDGEPVRVKAEPLDAFGEWLQVGIDSGWISEPICATHEGVPSSPEETEEWDAGEDPCECVVRVWNRALGM